ncbi:hypothetical protein [Leptospira santarosai]|uniref:hypothetical protein n=1 Tax=Leptospira santarosai TaxID=28183 RepID=UPI000297CEC2|nr:hypothetical protein [Leptospira santarosai]EKS06765.1 hypothetical protein LEP1GSC071_0257 [Leptospira santarosai str. JET]
MGIRSPIDSNQPPTNSSSYDPSAKYLPSETEIQTSLELEKSLEDQDLLKPEALQKTTSDFSALNKYVVLSPTEIDAEAQAWKNGTPLPEKTLTSEELKARYEAKITQMNAFYGNALSDIPKLSTLQLAKICESDFRIQILALPRISE